MGMYTALHLAIELRSDTPRDVIEILRFMTGDIEEPPVTPEHPLFQTSRWHVMLRCDSYYFPAQTGYALIVDDDTYYLTVLSNFKNYCGEITKFADWISPYITPCAPRWIGYSWYEEDDEPRSLYRREVLPSKV